MYSKLNIFGQVNFRMLKIQTTQSYTFRAMNFQKIEKGREIVRGNTVSEFRAFFLNEKTAKRKAATNESAAPV